MCKNYDLKMKCKQNCFLEIWRIWANLSRNNPLYKLQPPNPRPPLPSAPSFVTKWCKCAPIKTKLWLLDTTANLYSMKRQISFTRIDLSDKSQSLHISLFRLIGEI